MSDAARRPAPHVIEPGRNCWRTAAADRVAVLIDGARYFRVLRTVAAQAQQSIFVIGWDIDSRIELTPEVTHEDGLPRRLGDFFDALAQARHGLQIYLLDWDFTMLYATEREFLPLYNLGWRTHERVHFCLDGRHPAGASHHQKVVVVDDAIAFVGGIDLAKARWDTPEHAAEDSRRRTPDGEPYAPFHDVQMMVDGAAAAAVGELVRRRWQRATGKTVAPTSIDAPRAGWPADVEPDFVAVDVAIARTEPGYDGAEAVHEIKALYLDSIAAAQRSIYLENQYFTAPVITDAIAARLDEPDGPEVVIVSRRSGSGWLEDTTMSVLRARMLGRLAAADRHDHLRVYYPHQAGLDADDCIALHSKLAVIDDRFLRIGSANLNNRSMGLDSECDLALAVTEAAGRNAVTAVRDRLIAEHLGVTAERFAQTVTEQGSLIAAIECLSGLSRTLIALRDEVDAVLDEWVPEAAVIDPEHPIDIERLVETIVPPDARRLAASAVLVTAGLLLTLAGYLLGTRYGAYDGCLAPDCLRELGATIARVRTSPLWILGVCLLAALLFVPLMLLVALAVLLFGLWTGLGYALGGVLLGAGMGFMVGRGLGRERVRRVAGAWLNTLSRRFGTGGFLAVLGLRLLPPVPFAMSNIVAGATRVAGTDFFLGTLLGVVPGLLVAALCAERLVVTVAAPTPGNLAILLGLMLLLGVNVAAGWFVTGGRRFSA